MKHFTDKSLILLLAFAVLFSIFSVGAWAKSEENVLSKEDSEIVDGIVDSFMPLTEIPRQSHHEEKISNYLVGWAKDRGFSPTKDKQNNVIFDVPGTTGMESAPMTILQAHMDMVIAVKDGKTFDPQKDGITVINDGITITADGTSLGADDGMGVATILYYIENSKCHGPLRIIFTTNEEDGMTGAFGLTSKTTDGVTYVINLDSENSKEVTNSSAAGITIRFSFNPELDNPKKTTAMKVEISGLLSGHSGLEINKGRLNAIKAIGKILGDVENSGVDYELSDISGGSALNAIPAKATACVVIDSKDEKALRTSIDSTISSLIENYGAVETGLHVDVVKCELPEFVLTDESKSNTLNFINGIFNGVNSMSAYVDGLVESSSNLGLISVFADKDKTSTAGAYIRSSDVDKLAMLTYSELYIAEQCGIEAEPSKTADPWPVNPDSKLLELIKSAYKTETGTDISVVQLHAGLETGTFSQLNPNLDIVSIGFDISNPHTINETCSITTIPTTYKMLETVLENIGTEK